MQFTPCRKCKGKHRLPGYIQEGTKTVECSCHIQWRTKGVFSSRCKKASLVISDYDPLRDYMGKKSIAERDKLIRFAKEFESKYHDKMLYVWGPNGTQKTTLVNWVGTELVKSNLKVKYVMMQTLIEDLMPNFDNKEEKEILFKKYLNYDLLIVDESFSREKVQLWGSGAQLPHFDRFIRERFENGKKATIFVSNVSVNDIEANKFSFSIQNLVIRNTVKVGACLRFEDEYHALINDFSIGDIFG